MKKIIVISTSLRHGSNSDMLAEKFLEGALSAGNSVEKIFQYHILHHTAHADCYVFRNHHVGNGRDSVHSGSVPENRGSCSGRIYYGDYSAVFFHIQSK